MASRGKDDEAEERLLSSERSMRSPRDERYLRSSARRREHYQKITHTVPTVDYTLKIAANLHSKHSQTHLYIDSFFNFIHSMLHAVTSSTQYAKRRSQMTCRPAEYIIPKTASATTNAAPL